MNGKCPSTGEVCSQWEKIDTVRSKSIKRLPGGKFLPGGYHGLSDRNLEKWNTCMQEGIRSLKLHAYAVEQAPCIGGCALAGMDVAGMIKGEVPTPTAVPAQEA